MSKQSKPKLDERFLKNIKGKDFVLYAGLLDLAHQIGIMSIRVKTIQYPTKENGLEAICEAHVESKDNQDFTEIADANPNNVAPLVRRHVLRMAATRAKARALRDMTNIGITCLEELGNIDDEIENKSGKNNNAVNNTRATAKVKKVDGADNGKTKPQKAKASQEKKKEDKKETSETIVSSDTPKMSAAQKRAILSLGKRRGLSEDDLTKMSVNTFNMNFDYLDSSSASVFIRDLQQAA